MELIRKGILARYSEYKDSGIDWLGEMPAEWDLLANKYVFNLKQKLVGKHSSEYTLLSLTLNGIIIRNLEDGGKFPAEFNTYQEVKEGDFVFCLFDVEETPRCVGLSDFDGMITGAYTVMEVNTSFDKRYLYYYYLNLDKDKRMRPLYTGLRNTISKDNFFSLKTFVPPLQEQTAIANFLDQKTAQIDKAIEQKEKLIELLNERKQIVIQNAVTKGLDPNVKMKDSGVDWIGEIPEHWEVSKLKYYTNQIVDGAHFTPTYVDEGIPFLRVTDISNRLSDNINWSSTRRIPLKEHLELIKRANPQKGDILLSKNGTIGLTKVIDWDDDFSFFVSLCLIKPTDKLDPYYFCQFFDSPLVEEQLTYGSSRTSVTNLHLEKIKELLIVVPPISEQSALTVILKEINSHYANAIKAQLIQIEKIKEYKSVLIDSAVTGKIKVT